jgi:CubicO group peptidase (beta-lactamase class C family)
VRVARGGQQLDTQGCRIARAKVSARLHAAAERHVGEEKVPGLVALVARGGQVHAEALGGLSVGGPPVASDSIFRIASTVKPITAAATLAMAAEALIGLGEPVDRLLPERAHFRCVIFGSAPNAAAAAPYRRENGCGTARDVVLPVVAVEAAVSA